MSRIPAERAVALRAFSRYIGSREGRDHMKLNGYVSETPVVVAHEDEAVSSVMSRVQKTGHIPVLVCVHFPARTADLEFIELRPASEPSREHLPTGGSSTIGMLVDFFAGSEERFTFSVSAEITAVRLEPATV
ncbi:hypothetical protein ACFT5B_07035 [Luteimicrobium sp. NPDC057192]|uniref:hypothetical protein n=1 Tax=Luteimicrobium sp. NPDC057192 TaxID=3346042 RepID=UPI003628C1C0